MNKLVAIVAIVVGVASTAFAAVSFSQSTEGYWLSTSSSAIDEADSNYDLNAANTDNVYQQIVVAGWGTREMTKAVAEEVAAMRDGMEFLVQEQKRSATLLATMVALMGVIITLLSFGFMAQQTQISGRAIKTRPRAKSSDSKIANYFGISKP
jgi:multisubunit Na+/H+ antiporter MnhC subunit